jgi:phage shock protein A
VDEQRRLDERVAQMEQDMATLKIKLADAKMKLKGLQAGKNPRTISAQSAEKLTPGERKVRRAMGRFDHLQAQVDNLEARVRSYEVGGTVASVWSEPAAETRNPVIEEELDRLKKRVAKSSAEPETAEQS